MYICLDCGQREALTQHLRMQIRIFHGAPETQPLLLFIYVCMYIPKLRILQGVHILEAGFIEVVGFKFEFRRIALHMTVLEGA